MWDETISQSHSHEIGLANKNNIYTNSVSGDNSSRKDIYSSPYNSSRKDNKNNTGTAQEYFKSVYVRATKLTCVRID